MPDSTFLEWPFVEARHKQLAQELRVWAAREVPKIVGADHSRAAVDAACKKLVKALGEGGWLKYAVPSPHGGHFPQLDVRSIAIIRETLGYHSGLADFSFAMQGLGSGSIALFGGSEQKAHYLPKVGAGTQIAAFALSEPEGGSDVAGMRCTAKRDGNHFVLDGKKTWISNGGIANHYVTFVRTGEAL